MTGSNALMYMEMSFNFFLLTKPKPLFRFIWSDTVVLTIVLYDLSSWSIIWIKFTFRVFGWKVRTNPDGFDPFLERLDGGWGKDGLNPKGIFADYAGWPRPPDFDGRSRSHGLSGTRAGTMNGVRQSRPRRSPAATRTSAATPKSAQPRAREGGRRGRLRARAPPRRSPPPPPRAPPRLTPASSATPRSEVPSARGPRARLRLATREGGREARLPPHALASTPCSGLRRHAPLPSLGAREGRGRLRLAARTSTARPPPPGHARGRRGRLRAHEHHRARKVEEDKVVGGRR